MEQPQRISLDDGVVCLLGKTLVGSRGLGQQEKGRNGRSLSSTSVAVAHEQFVDVVGFLLHSHGRVGLLSAIVFNLDV